MGDARNGELPKMVDWYDPRQLLDTARKTLISTIIGENADPRLVSAAVPDGKFFDYSKQLSIDASGEFQTTGEDRNEIWIDYVSDVGDGWNPTYSVAYSLAKKHLPVPGKQLRRGEILILGGDAVYPTANPEEYRKRLLTPYRMAFNASRDTTDPSSPENETDLKKAPHVFALPGNHDWYDSLVAFQKLFCTSAFNRRIFAGGWRTRQKQSYFALKLPQKWWLLGADLQLSHNLDMRQLEYFESVRQKMERGDKAILLVPEPYWVKAIKYRGMTRMFEEIEAGIDRLEKRFSDKDVEIKLYLAGDLHHYRRFESHDGNRIQKITAGGGGAFLHPTHDFDFREQFAGKEPSKEDFSLEAEYPAPDVSRGLDWKNLHSFVQNNRTFGILTGILYAIMAILIHGDVKGEFTLLKALSASVNRGLVEPLALLVVILTIMGLIFFTDSNSTIYRRTAGAIHGLTHLTAIFFLGWLGFLVMRSYVGYENYNNDVWLADHSTYVNVLWFVSVVVVCFIGGYVIGSIIMGIYLFVSLHIFGRHDNEAFSAMKIEDYKNFVRLHIDSQGKLTIYPIKIDKVGRDWEDAKGTRRPKQELNAELIEEPITL